MKFNQEQQLAIQALGKNIMVSASAGSGKTTVLIARLMKRIVEDHVRLDEICAMTFTEKAASEMKKRLAQALHKHYIQTEDPFIGQQLSLLATAQISTIHSFCRAIITEFGYLIGFKQDRINHLLDSLEQTKLQKQATDLLMNQYYGNQDPVFTQLSLAYSTRSYEDDNLIKDVIKLYTLALAQLKPYEWLEAQKKRYDISSFKQAPTILQDLNVHFIQEGLTDLQTQLSALINAFNDYQIPYDFSENSTFLHQLQKLLQTKSWAQIRQLMEHQSFPKLPSLTKKYATYFTHAFEQDALKLQIKTLHDAFSAFDWEYLYGYETKEAYQQNQAFTELMCSMAIDYGHYYEALKEQANVLDFNDLEQAAYLILAHPEKIASTILRQRYTDILVDEFQDTNYFQDKIIQLIAREDNVFRVGDIKQSIYGFRNAKPELMMDRMNTQDDQHETLYLSYNYRSKQSIVDFNNHIFSHVMNLKDLDSQYTNKDAVKIGITQQTENNLPITLMQIEYDKTMVVDDQEIYINKNKALLNKIAQDIKQKIKDGHRPKDICVLSRSHTVKRELKEAFELFDIPYFFDDREGFTNSWAVFDVLNGLQVFHDPHQDFYFLAFLLSGFCKLDENDVAKLKLLNPKASLFDNLKTTFPELYTALNQLFASMLEQSLVDQLILLTQFKGYYYDHLDFHQRNNINLLIQKAATFEGSSLEFIEFINLYDHIDSSNAASDDESSNRVKVMTVHASKGLQFPITYYITPQKTGQKIGAPLCLMDSDLGICFNTMDFDSQRRTKTNLRLAFELFVKNKEVQESLRLLYVALTRAQDELILVDGYQEPSEDKAVETVLNWRSLMNGMGHAPIIRHILKAAPLPYVNHEVVTIDAIQTQQKTSEVSHFPFTIKPYQPREYEVAEETYRSLDVQLDLQPGLKASEIGTLLHQIISELPARHWTLKDLQPYDLTETQQQQLLNYSHHPKTNDLMKGKVAHEVGFTHHLEKETRVGIMDMVIEFDEKIVLIDFKSDRVKQPQQLVDRYRHQLQNYVDFLKIQFPQKPIHAYIYALNLDDYIELV